MSKKEEFEERFITNFLSSYVAKNFEWACTHDRHDMLRNPPVEDAKHLAECAWEKCCEHLGWEDE